MNRPCYIVHMYTLYIDRHSCLKSVFGLVYTSLPNGVMQSVHIMQLCSAPTAKMFNKTFSLEMYSLSEILVNSLTLAIHQPLVTEHMHEICSCLVLYTKSMQAAHKSALPKLFSVVYGPAGIFPLQEL